MNKKLLICLIDSFRFDFISKKNTPFLFKLAKNGYYSKLKSILGYSVGIDPVIFSGTYPEQNNIWTYLEYNPNDSKIARILMPLDLIPRSRFSRYLHALTYKLLQILKIVKYKEFPYNLPFKKLKFFKYALKNHITKPKSLGKIPTIVDLFIKFGIKIKILGWAGSDNSIVKHFLQMKNLNDDVLFIYLSDLDGILHKYGIESTRTINKLREIDEVIAKLYDKLSKSWNKFSTIILSDHGVSEVKKRIDLESLIKRNTGLKEYNDYLAFYDSTMARFWFFNEKSKLILSKFLKSKQFGDFLDDNQFKNLHIKFSHNKYGDACYLMNPGFIIYPNYYSIFTSPKAMHSYDPNYEEMKGVLLIYPFKLNSKNKDSEEIASIFPTILNYFNINIPNYCKGKAI